MAIRENITKGRYSGIRAFTNNCHEINVQRNIVINPSDHLQIDATSYAGKTSIDFLLYFILAENDEMSNIVSSRGQHITTERSGFLFNYSENVKR